MVFFRFLIALMVAFALLSSSALAKSHSKNKTRSEVSQFLADRELDSSVRYVINNSLFTIYHEVGHLLVDKLDWPVLGREEDIADNFATYILLSQRRRSFQQALKDAALGWKLEDQFYGGERDESDYYAVHSLDLQRAFQIVCMMVGQDRDTFYSTAQEWGIDRRRQATCRDDYQQISRSIERLIKSNPENSLQAKVSIDYERAGADLSLAYKTLRDSRLLESVAEDLSDNFGLSADIKITASRCEEANAFYDEDTSEIIMCYELLQDYFTTIERYNRLNNIN
ncbi:hypothetical protein MNBD_ALPHA11-2143 [hydrothermal vent metagenome]|uniref:Metallopeptidase n=1 Tax=hydrothermal vent metagenome TaxID=652676 RepID=A0A3B0UIE6_9ZZZZ